MVGTALFGLPFAKIAYASRNVQIRSPRIKLHEKTGIDSISEQDLKTILKKLNRFVLGETHLGTIIQQFSEKQSLKTLRDPNLKPGVFDYRQYLNLVVYNEPTDIDKIRGYAIGNPPETCLAHILVHALQDQTSKWDAFETVIANAVLRGEEGISIQSVKEFAKTCLADPDRPFPEVVKEFNNWFTAYYANETTRTLIRETLTHLTLEDHTTVESLDLTFQNPKIHPWRTKVSDTDFETAFNYGLRLLGTCDEVTASTTIASINTLSEYKARLEQLEEKAKVKDGYKKGLERQKRMQEDRKRIIVKTLDLLAA